MKVAILGASGMLGSMMLDVFAKSKHQIVATVRSADLKAGYSNVEYKLLDAEEATVQTLKSLLKDVDWVVNCIGVIKPYIHDDNAAEIIRAAKVNSLFPHYLGKAIQDEKTKVLQIATDCVFSGEAGYYAEDDLHDPADVYGKTKSLGEVKIDNYYNLRASIIGPEKKTHKSFLDWVLTQPQNAELKGFVNHTWNGVTTLQFSKICLGILNSNPDLKNLQHIIPANVLTKYEMVESFKKYFRRDDIRVEKFSAPKSVHRTLKTNYPDLNKRIWNAADYSDIPTVEEMISELSDYVTQY